MKASSCCSPIVGSWYNSTHSRMRSLLAKHIVQRLSSKRVRQIEIRVQYQVKFRFLARLYSSSFLSSLALYPASTTLRHVVPSPSRSSPSEKPHVMFTGMIDKAGEKTVRELGGELVDSIYNCTHLVTDKVSCVAVLNVGSPGLRVMEGWSYTSSPSPLTLRFVGQ